jgi:transposase
VDHDLLKRAKDVAAINTHTLNPLNPELNPICYLLALLAHHFLDVSRIRVKSLTLRLLMSYIYMEHLFLMFLDHTQ